MSDPLELCLGVAAIIASIGFGSFCVIAGISMYRIAQSVDD